MKKNHSKHSNVTQQNTKSHHGHLPKYGTDSFHCEKVYFKSSDFLTPIATNLSYRNEVDKKKINKSINTYGNQNEYFSRRCRLIFVYLYEPTTKNDDYHMGRAQDDWTAIKRTPNGNKILRMRVPV